MSRVVGIMQPYFFPYLGYWQLVGAVDRFVIYDDVQYIKGGWINRNRLLINGEPTFVTVPLNHPSPNKRICELTIRDAPDWRSKMLRTLEVAYGRAPGFADVFPVLERLIVARFDTLAEYLIHQIRSLADLFGMRTEFAVASNHCRDRNNSGQDRVIDICCQEGAGTYINLVGGQSLYQASRFAERGIDLRFLAMRPIPYRQRFPGFAASLSIIDVLMEVGFQGMPQHLSSFELLPPSPGAA